jgi:hypothetical protein
VVVRNYGSMLLYNRILKKIIKKIKGILLGKSEHIFSYMCNVVPYGSMVLNNGNLTIIK